MLRRLGTLFALPLAALVTTAGPAQAQPSEPPAQVSRQGLWELHQYARCVVFNRAAQVRQLLAMEPFTPDFTSRLSNLVDRLSQCTHGRLSGGTLLFVGALAEQLMARQQGGLSLASATAHDGSRPAIRAYDESDYMAMCLLRSHPDRIAELFGTRPGSPEEVTAIGAIQPHLAGCMSAGQRIRMNRPALRAVLALASFRLMNHNAAPAAAPGN